MSDLIAWIPFMILSIIVLAAFSREIKKQQKKWEDYDNNEEMF